MGTEPNGRTLRDQGWEAVQAADTAPHRGYRHHVEVALAELIRTGQMFDADEIRRRVPDEVEAHSPNLLPSVLGSWARAGRIVPIGYRNSGRASRHASRNRVWIGAALQNEGVA